MQIKSFCGSKSQLTQVFHVRSVTQGDVIRADAKEIPRIFQVHSSDSSHSHMQFFHLVQVMKRTRARVHILTQSPLKVLYAGEGESRKPDENSTHPALSEQAEKDKVATIVMKVLYKI